MTNKQKLQEINSTQQNNGNSQKIEVPTFIDIERTLGAIAILSMRSQSHKYIFAHDYEWLFLPAISLQQFVLFRAETNEPIAFVSWASVSEEVEKRIASGIAKLQPKDWNSGNKIYIMDIINPFGSETEILIQLNENQLKDKEVKIFVPRQDGRGLEMRILSDVVLELKNKKLDQ